MSLSTTNGSLTLEALSKSAVLLDPGTKSPIDTHLILQLPVCRGVYQVISHLATCPTAFAFATTTGSVNVWGWADEKNPPDLNSPILAPQGLLQEVKVSHTIGCLALSWDGKSVAIGDVSGCVTVFTKALPIQQSSLPFEGHTECVEGLVFKRDGSKLVSASSEKVKVHCVITGRTLWTRKNLVPVMYVVLCGDLEHIVTASEDKKLRLDGLEVRKDLETPAFKNKIHSMAADPSPSASRVVCGLSDGSGVIWNFSEQSGAQSKATYSGIMLRCSASRGAVSSVTFSPDSKFVAMVAEDKVVRIFDACRFDRGAQEVYQELYIVTFQSPPVCDSLKGVETVLDFSNTFFRISWVGRLLCANDGAHVLAWKVTCGAREPRESKVDHEGMISAIAISDTHQFIAIAGDNLVLKIFYYENTPQPEKEATSLYRVFDTSSVFDQLLFSPSGHHIVGTSSRSGTVQGWKFVGTGIYRCKVQGSLPEAFEAVIARLDQCSAEAQEKMYNPFGHVTQPSAAASMLQLMQSEQGEKKKERKSRKKPEASASPLAPAPVAPSAEKAQAENGAKKEGKSRKKPEPSAPVVQTAPVGTNPPPTNKGDGPVTLPPPTGVETEQPLPLRRDPNKIRIAEQIAFMLDQVAEMEKVLGIDAPSPVETRTLQAKLSALTKENAALRKVAQSLREELVMERQRTGQTDA